MGEGLFNPNKSPGGMRGSFAFSYEKNIYPSKKIEIYKKMDYTLTNLLRFAFMLLMLYWWVGCKAAKEKALYAPAYMYGRGIV